MPKVAKANERHVASSFARTYMQAKPVAYLGACSM